MRRCLEIVLLATGLSLFCTASFRFMERWAVEARPQLTELFQPKLKIAGRLEIPRLDIHVLVMEGDEREALSLAAEHLVGTPAFGAGNTVIAAHRDAEFRDLRRICLGDRLRVCAGNTYIYVVKRIRVVRANDITALRQTATPMLTLVTCYPFRYVGSAPERFIVQAELAGS